MKKYLWLFITAIILTLTACGEADEAQVNEGTSEESDKQLTVMTTIYPLQFFAGEIGGEYVEATSILPPGSDAHSYEPTSKEMIAVAEADLFIYNEAQAESYAVAIKEALADEDVSFLEASTGLDMITYLHDHSHAEADHDYEEDDHAHEDDDDHEGDDYDHASDEHAEEDHDHGDYDTHVWLSPQLSIDLSENILEELIRLMPEQESYFRDNYDVLVEKLTALDASFKEVLDEVPNKTILVTHAAYNYWARDYGIEQLAVTGLSPSNEPSQQQLIQLIDLVEDRNIDTILFEQNISSKVSEVIRDEAGLETKELHNLSTLRTEDIEANEDYFSLMERNLDVLKEVLSNE
jgi:zinc transport system substrate-binding protein